MYEQICPESRHHGSCRLHTNPLVTVKTCSVAKDVLWKASPSHWDAFVASRGSDVAPPALFCACTVIQPQCWVCERTCELLWCWAGIKKLPGWKVHGDAKLKKPFTRVAFHFTTLSVFCFCRIHTKLSCHWRSPTKPDYARHHLIHISSLNSDHLISVLGHLIKHADTHVPFSERNNYSDNKNNRW